MGLWDWTPWEKRRKAREAAEALAPPDQNHGDDLRIQAIIHAWAAAGLRQQPRLRVQPRYYRRVTITWRG